MVEEKKNEIQTVIDNNIDINEDWEQQIKLVKEMTAKNCSMEEFKMLCITAKLYDLNPLKKEIWAIKYLGNPANIMVGRDGFLTIAHKSGQFNGMETDYTLSNKGTGNPAITSTGTDMKSFATCRVYRKDMDKPISVTVYMNEYYSNVNPVWRSKPITMLKKVAEAQALRKAFNVSGVYSPEELDQVKEEPISQIEGKSLQEIAKEAVAKKEHEAEIEAEIESKLELSR